MHTVEGKKYNYFSKKKTKEKGKPSPKLTRKNTDPPPRVLTANIDSAREIIKQPPPGSPILAPRPPRPSPDDEHEKQAKPIPRRLLPVPSFPKSPAIPETLAPSAANQPLRRLRRDPAIQVSPNSSSLARNSARKRLPGRAEAAPSRDFFFWEFLSRVASVEGWVEIAWALTS